MLEDTIAAIATPIGEGGLGIVRRVFPFPPARRRGRFNDTSRSSLLARRFAPRSCVAMDEGAELQRRDGKWSTQKGTLKISSVGNLVELEP